MARLPPRRMQLSGQKLQTSNVERHSSSHLESSHSGSSDPYMQMVDMLIAEGTDYEASEGANSDSDCADEDEVLSDRSSNDAQRSHGLIRQFSTIAHPSMDSEGPLDEEALRIDDLPRSQRTKSMDRVDSALSYRGKRRSQGKIRDSAEGSAKPSRTSGDAEGAEATSLYTAPTSAFISPFGHIPQVGRIHSSFVICAVL